MKTGRSWSNKTVASKITDLKKLTEVVKAWEDRGYALDPSMALDAVSMSGRFLPGTKLPFEIERKDDDAFDHLLPVPWNDDIYSDSNVYKSPFKCQTWPDSPFCKNPVEQAQHKPFGIDVEVVYNDCNVCVKITYDLSYYRFPLQTLCYRRPECIEKEPQENPPPVPMPPPSGTGEGEPCRSCVSPLGNYGQAIWARYAYDKSNRETITYLRAKMLGNGQIVDETITQSVWTTAASYVGAGVYKSPPIPYEEFSGFDWADPENQVRYQYTSSPMPVGGGTGIFIKYYPNNTVRRTTDEEKEQIFRDTGTRPETIVDGFDPFNGVSIAQWFYVRSKGDEARLLAFTSEAYYPNYSYFQRDNRSGATNVSKTIKNWKVGLVWRDTPPPITLPPPPPPNPPKDTMTCCNETEEKLDYIIAKLGLKIYPMVVQKDLTKEPDKELNPAIGNEAVKKWSDSDLEERGLVKLEDMTNFLAWKAFNLFKTLGDFPFEVTTTTDEGQNESTKFENLRQAIQFLSVKGIATGFDADNAWSAIQLVLYEQAQQKAAMQKTVDLLLAICESIGFQLDSQKREIQIPFTLPEGNTQEEIASKLDTYPIKDLLKPRTAEVASFRNADSTITLIKTLAQIEKAAKTAAVAATEVSKQQDGADTVSRIRALVKYLLRDKEPSEELKDNTDWDSQLLAIEMILNDYLKANGAPEIKIRSTEQRTVTPPNPIGG